MWSKKSFCKECRVLNETEVSQCLDHEAVQTMFHGPSLQTSRKLDLQGRRVLMLALAVCEQQFHTNPGFHAHDKCSSKNRKPLQATRPTLEQALDEY